MDPKYHIIKDRCILPEKFNNPFDYVPHRLCIKAAEETVKHIETQPVLKAEAQKGKMFGVLIATDMFGNTGFFSAFSGLLAGSNDHDFFVPPVYDATKPDSRFKTEENIISEITFDINDIKESPEYRTALHAVEKCRAECEKELDRYKTVMKQAKQRRDAIRSREGGITPEENEQLLNESRHLKASLRRLKADIAAKEARAAVRLKDFNDDIDELKKLRKEMSENLQRWLFNRYAMLNCRLEARSLISIFRDTPLGVPPAGAGDCCAPKLLQYAFSRWYAPVAMAEFWYGESPRGEIRHHLHFYPACRSKCLPILTHMLQGMKVDKGARGYGVLPPVEVVYEDEWLAVVSKPSGMMSVKGRDESVPSVEAAMKERYGGRAMLVHRLDQDTSGLLITALSPDVYKDMQRRFALREVEKSYIALLEKRVDKPEKGVIELPLYADPLDRPYQKVDYERGKAALTEYIIKERGDDFTLVELHPVTGRTHQLRVHCAHKLGLGAPVRGDNLYGTTAGRLCLHAEKLSFVHPVTGKLMRFTDRNNMFDY